MSRIEKDKHTLHEETLKKLCVALACTATDLLGFQIMNIAEVLDYEIRSSWWAPWISYKWAQNLAASYYSYKVSRKFNRYKRNSVDFLVN